MAVQQFLGTEGLRALADDITDVLAGGQMIRRGDAEDLDRDDAVNVRYLWRQMFRRLTLAVGEYNFNRLIALLSLRSLFWVTYPRGPILHTWS